MFIERHPLSIDAVAFDPAAGPKPGAVLGKVIPAAVSLAVSALLLAALLGIGAIGEHRRTETSSLTVVSLAVLKGVEDGAEDAKAAEKRAPVPAAAPPSRPVSEKPPEPAITLPSTVSALATTSAMPPKPAAPAPAPAQAAAAPSTSGPAAAAASAAAPPARRGVADGLDADAPAGTSRAYAARVRSWLYAHKTYPKLARMRREEGVVNVRFILDRAGLLLDGRVIGSSGRASLDQEAIAMMQRSSPFPKAPREIAGDRIEFIAPVAFILPI